MRILAVLLSTILVYAASACSPEPGDGDADGDTDVDSDADTDADGDIDGCDPSAECCADAECTDGIYCNGLERCDRGRCEPGFPIDCSDEFDCTRDECDESANRCVHMPQHDECDDGEICNGDERCAPLDPDADSVGCVTGTPRRCDDHDPCTDDYCEDGECRVRIRDSDGDGYGDWDCAVCTDPTDPDTCMEGDDCNDTLDTVYPGAEEICDDGQDNDCDRVRDYADPFCSVPNNTCATAIELRAGATVYSSTRGTTADIHQGCGPAGGRDVAFYFALSAESDVTLSLDTARAGLHIAITADCGGPAGTIACETGRVFDVTSRAMAPGTYFVVATADSEIDFSIRLTVSPSGARMPGDTCAEAIDLAGDGTAVAGTLVGSAHDYTVSCAETEDPTYDVVYRLTVPTEQTADFVLTRTSGTGPITLAVQDTCGLFPTERSCWTGEPEAEGRLWRVLPGTYYLVVAHPEEVTYTVSATLSPLDPDFFYGEDFTGGSPGWTLGGAWSRGTPIGGIEPPADGGPCIGTTMGGSMMAGLSYTRDYAQTPDIDLRGASAPVLRFSSWLDQDPWGYDAGFRIDISRDGGAFSTATAVTPAYDGGMAWFGDHTPWSTWEVDLSAYAGSVVSIRFAAYSYSWLYDTGAGWYVDDILVIDL